MGMDTMIGVDLAKSVFQVHGASVTGEVRYRRKQARPAFRTFTAEPPPAVVVLEACRSAHYWARVLSSFGHEVKLIGPALCSSLCEVAEERCSGHRGDRDGSPSARDALFRTQARVPAERGGPVLLLATACVPAHGYRERGACGPL